MVHDSVVQLVELSLYFFDLRQAKTTKGEI